MINDPTSITRRHRTTARNPSSYSDKAERSFRIDQPGRIYLPSPHFDCLTQESVLQFLGEVETKLLDRSASESQISELLHQVFGVLQTHRRLVDKEKWDEFRFTLRQLKLKEILHEDPFTRRAFEKPRGYAGDAVLLDYIYDRYDHFAVPPLSDVGRRVWNWTTVSPPCQGVELRRRMIAKLIDETALRAPNSRILSFAAGHLREARLSHAIQNERIGELVAIDNDAKSLDEIHRCYPSSKIVCYPESAKNIIAGKFEIGNFDLIYSSGLYDYLNDGIASKLTKRLFAKLNSGGRLLLTNFLPNVEAVGYMEAFMDWNLIYRSRWELTRLTRLIDEAQIKSITLFAEDAINIIFCIVEKR